MQATLHAEVLAWPSLVTARCLVILYGAGLHTRDGHFQGASQTADPWSAKCKDLAAECARGEDTETRGNEARLHFSSIVPPAAYVLCGHGHTLLGEKFPSLLSHSKL
jgi:hypothetical protein